MALIAGARVGLKSDTAVTKTGLRMRLRDFAGRVGVRVNEGDRDRQQTDEEDSPYPVGFAPMLAKVECWPPVKARLTKERLVFWMQQRLSGKLALFAQALVPEKFKGALIDSVQKCCKYPGPTYSLRAAGSNN